MEPLGLVMSVELLALLSELSREGLSSSGGFPNCDMARPFAGSEFAAVE
jgi:hypothetical protein